MSLEAEGAKGVFGVHTTDPTRFSPFESRDGDSVSLYPHSRYTSSAFVSMTLEAEGGYAQRGGAHTTDSTLIPLVFLPLKAVEETAYPYIHTVLLYKGKSAVSYLQRRAAET
jgi:hypothetical protein